MRPKLDDVILFLDDWKPSSVVKEEFKMSNVEWSNLSKWMIRTNIIERVSLNVPNKTNRVFLYKVKRK